MEPRLPVRVVAGKVLNTIRQHPVTVIIAETGSGKTTQISQILYEAGLGREGRIGVTQPRRVAAVSVARRVAEERGGRVGQEVGYAVRFEERVSTQTVIKYLTDGTLLRECLEDPELNQYSVIVLDEAHERSLNTDILFGLLKRLVYVRAKPLKLVITSATLDGDKFSAYFNNCPVLNIPGRCFDVQIIHAAENHEQQYVQAAVDVALDIHVSQPPGDVLVFLAGQADIEKAVAALTEAVAGMAEGQCGDVMILPIYAAMPLELQARVFAPGPAGCRRIIVATNIAETSVTVDGVTYVIDPGVVKQKRYNPQTGLDSLELVPISRVQAVQRAGRAGRTKPGKCFRLYTRKFFERDMQVLTVPEIQRTSLLTAVLYLKSLDLQVDVLAFDYVDPPEPAALEDALRQLYVLDAIDAGGCISPRGRQMVALPLDPSLARMLLAAAQLGCLPDALTVAAMLSAETLFVGGRGPEAASMQSDQAGKAGGTREGRDELQALMAEGQGDHIMFLRLYQAWDQSGWSASWCKSMGVELTWFYQSFAASPADSRVFLSRVCPVEAAWEIHKASVMQNQGRSLHGGFG
ncbi:hypothetical protein WJX72_005695 [[Myrmecia] bisecta]|uniref:RNA helicase n=1 Tax=[Myrmecia] bisecta TaxID=41462 RepID=A0AAW1PK10_9CHLO